MTARVYEILEAVHEDALTEHRTRPTEFTGLVLRAVGEAMTEIENDTESPARQLGRRGGQKGGQARAKKLSPEERSAIAKAAAAARWGKRELVCKH